MVDSLIHVVDAAVSQNKQHLVGWSAACAHLVHLLRILVEGIQDPAEEGGSCEADRS